VFPFRTEKNKKKIKHRLKKEERCPRPHAGKQVHLVKTRHQRIEGFESIWKRGLFLEKIGLEGRKKGAQSKKKSTKVREMSH